MTRIRVSILVAAFVVTVAAMVSSSALGRDQVHAQPPSADTQAGHPADSSSAPMTLMEAVRQITEASGGDAAMAARTLRMLRSNVGRSGESLYAFEQAPGATCLIMWKRSSTCSTAPTDASIVFMVSGGYPAWATPDGVAVPSVLIGVVRQDVASITFDDGTGGAQLPIDNQAFAVELDDGAALKSRGTLTIEHASGKRETIYIPLG